MVKKDELNKAFSERLQDACLSAGVAGRGLPGRIKAALKKQNVSISEPGIFKWLNAGSVPSSTNILALSRWLNVRPEWLEYGRGAMRDNGQIAPDLSSDTSQEGDFYRVDVLDVQASAGPGTFVSTEFIERIRAIEYTNEQAAALFGNRPADMVKIITVRGDSMEGTINPGDDVFADMAVTSFDGDGIYVFVFGNTLHIKRLQMQGNQLSVISDNQRYRDWHIKESDEDQFFIMAKVLLRQSIDYKRFW